MKKDTIQKLILCSLIFKIIELKLFNTIFANKKVMYDVILKKIYKELKFIFNSLIFFIVYFFFLTVIYITYCPINYSIIV